MDDNQLVVEVNLDGLVYRAFVEDVKPHVLEVSFENNWKPLCLIEFGKVRFPPDENTDAASFKAKQLVEVKQKDAKTKVSHWCKAILRELNSATGRWLVEYVIPNEETLQQVVPMRNIRHVNEKPFIGQSTLDKVEIEIPRHLRKIAAVVGIHDDFRKEVLADFCKFLSQSNILRLISRNGEFTRKKVNLLKVSHINYLDSEQKRVSSPNEAPVFSESFRVEEHLIGLSLRKNYANLKKARQIKDIIKIDFDVDNLRFRVCGKTELAVKTARDMLEYLEHFSTIPKYLAEELLEDDGNIIAGIVQESGLVRIESGEDEDDDTSDDYPITFVGNPPCIENAKVLLEYQLKLIDRKLKKKQTAKGESAISNDPNLIVNRVPIKKELKGLAVGKNYENLKKAQNIPGIVKIDVPTEMSMIIIYAQNEAAGQAARRLLELDEDTVEVEHSSLGKIIGKGGVTIKQIESSNEGVRVRIPKVVQASDLSSDGKVIIKVCGPAHKVPATIDLIKRAEMLGHL